MKINLLKVSREKFFFFSLYNNNYCCFYCAKVDCIWQHGIVTILWFVLLLRHQRDKISGYYWNENQSIKTIAQAWQQEKGTTNNNKLSEIDGELNWDHFINSSSVYRTLNKLLFYKQFFCFINKSSLCFFCSCRSNKAIYSWIKR